MNAEVFRIVGVSIPKRQYIIRKQAPKWPHVPYESRPARALPFIRVSTLIEPEAHAHKGIGVR